MKRNTLYIVFLVVILTLVSIYASYGISESFSTLQSIYKRSDGKNNMPCGVLRINITPEALEKWFIGKITVLPTKETDELGRPIQKTVEEKPLMEKFLIFLLAIKGKCKFDKIHKYLDDVTKNKDNVRIMADIVKDVSKILQTIVRDTNTTQKPGIIDKLVSKYANKEGFTTYLEVEDIIDENNVSKSCENLENIIQSKYFTTENLTYTHQTINGLERLLCECYNDNEKIKKDIEKILKKKNKNPDGTYNNENIEKDLQKIKNTVIQIKENFNLIKMYVNAKVAELELQNTLSQ